MLRIDRFFLLFNELLLEAKSYSQKYMSYDKAMKMKKWKKTFLKNDRWY